jgi:hypothetical protein
MTLYLHIPIVLLFLSCGQTSINSTGHEPAASEGDAVMATIELDSTCIRRAMVISILKDSLWVLQTHRTLDAWSHSFISDNAGNSFDALMFDAAQTLFSDTLFIVKSELNPSHGVTIVKYPTEGVSGVFDFLITEASPCSCEIVHRSIVEE